jgi:hypothetical protein
MAKTIHIYTLSDPRDGRVRYVGRTVNPLSRRLREHINTAKRGKLKDKQKEAWILELLAARLKPEIAAVEAVTIDDFKLAEKRWVSHYRASHSDLLNIKCGGDGGMGGHFVVWTPELDALLGKVADSRIAETLGVSRKTVTYRRDQLGIAASFDRARNLPPPMMGGHNRITLPDAVIAVLGTMPDQKLAEIAGVSKKRIIRERTLRGILSFAELTGNSGKFGAKAKARKIEMDDPRWSILGTMADEKAAAILGLSWSRVATIRNLKGIPSYRSKLNGIESPRTPI